MKISSLKIKNKIIFLTAIPILIFIIIIVGRKIVMPTNDEIVEELKNTKMYTCDVEYTFRNIRDEFKENTKQYYRYDKGGRIEFTDYYKRVKVYYNNKIKVQKNDNEYSVDTNLDCIYPQAFLNNILSSNINEPIKELEEEWGDGKYLKVSIRYDYKNRYLNTAEFYIDKNKKIPVLLKIFDESGNERITVKYSNFEKQKYIDSGLF